MRLRRRHHTESRMLEQVTGKYLLSDATCPPDTRIAERKKAYFAWEEIFSEVRPLCVEVGCGMGSFAVEFCKRNADKNLVAVERNANVVMAASELAEQSGLENLRMLWSPAECLTRYFRPESVSALFLNFSPPLPQKPYVRQRLTNPRFLKLYDEMLVSGGMIYLKTDSASLYEYSKEQFETYGFEVLRAETDLYACADISENIATEYEKRFVGQGLPIYALTARKR